MGTIEQRNILTRLAEWNIQSGGFESYDSTAETPQNLLKIQKGIRRIHASFISLIDTYRWDQLYTPKDLQKMFGYKHAYCINLEDDRLKSLGHNNGITVLSDLDVENFETIRIGTRNAVKTTLKLNDGFFDIFSVYLDDVREKTRLEQIRTLLQHVTPNRRTIIMGDFNCVSDSDMSFIQKNLENLIQKLPKATKTKLHSVEEKLEHHGAIRFIEAKGFLDTDIKRTANVPTHKSSSMVFPFLRLDYVFRTSGIKIASTKVVRNRLFNQTSDHFPLVVEIKN